MRSGVLIAEILLVLCLITVTGHAQDIQFEEWVRFAESREAGVLKQWVRGVAGELLGEQRCGRPLPVRAPSFFGRFGIFITVVKGRAVRGCYGAFDHRSDDLETVLREYIVGALRNDMRHNPLDVGELEDARVIITIADRGFPVDDLQLLDLSRFGVTLVSAGGGSVIYVPAEIRSASYLDSVVKTLRPVQVNAFRAVTID
ncbi:MAG TPA: AMMECR1 domain-containing protein [Spirochaetota bacterium]|nr:AMMECR1 domain-containing protein [Spirochaetota bacterium]